MKKPNVSQGIVAPIATLTALLAVAVAGFLYGLSLAVLGLATCALVLVVALLWGSVSSLAGDTPLSLDEALSYGAPSFEEEQKTAVLRALNDLKYERSVGKISEEDFNELSARYRVEAKRLIAQVDESLAETRKLAEQLAQDQLRLAGIETESADGSAGPKATEPSVESAEQGEATQNDVTCVACQTANDPDARFCKRCGKALLDEGLEKVSSTEKSA